MKDNFDELEQFLPSNAFTPGRNRQVESSLLVKRRRWRCSAWNCHLLGGPFYRLKWPEVENSGRWVGSKKFQSKNEARPPSPKPGFWHFLEEFLAVIWLQLRLSSKIRNVVYKVCLFWCCYRRVEKWQWFDMKVQLVNPKKEGAVLQWRYFSYAKLSFIRWNYV